jgi:hypothetical protein
VPFNSQRRLTRRVLLLCGALPCLWILSLASHAGAWPAPLPEGVHRYTDNQPDYRITMRVSKSRVIQASLVLLTASAAHCSDSNGVTRGAYLEGGPIRNGRFENKEVQSPNEHENVTMVVTGRLTRGVIRGKASVSTQILGNGAKTKCWTGTSYLHPGVPYVAELK